MLFHCVWSCWWEYYKCKKHKIGCVEGFVWMWQVEQWSLINSIKSFGCTVNTPNLFLKTNWSPEVWKTSGYVSNAQNINTGSLLRQDTSPIPWLSNRGFVSLEIRWIMESGFLEHNHDREEASQLNFWSQDGWCEQHIVGSQKLFIRLSQFQPLDSSGCSWQHECLNEKLHLIQHLILPKGSSGIHNSAICVAPNTPLTIGAVGRA